MPQRSTAPHSANTARTSHQAIDRAGDPDGHDPHALAVTVTAAVPSRPSTPPSAPARHGAVALRRSGLLSERREEGPRASGGLGFLS